MDIESFIENIKFNIINEIRLRWDKATLLKLNQEEVLEMLSKNNLIVSEKEMETITERINNYIEFMRKIPRKPNASEIYKKEIINAYDVLFLEMANNYPIKEITTLNETNLSSDDFEEICAAVNDAIDVYNESLENKNRKF